MEYSQSDFLKQLNKEIIGLLNSGVTLQEVITKINCNEISFNAFRKFVAVSDKDFDWVANFKRAINAIRTIISSPKIHLRTDKVILNVDIVSKIDATGVRMTVQEPRFWKKKNGGDISPEYVFANVYEDELPIYENRFLCLLINKMYVFISLKLSQLYEKTSALDDFVDKNEISISDVDAIKSSAYFYKDDDGSIGFDDSLPLLTPTDNKVREYIEKLTDIKISLNKIRKTPFYNICMKAKKMLDTEVKPTNVLTMHPDYRICYEFYRQLNKYVEKEHRNLISSKEYFNYVVLNVLQCLGNLGFTFPQNHALSTENGKISLKALQAEKSPIRYEITTTEDGKIVVDVSLVYTVNKFVKSLHLKEKRHAKYLIDVSPNLKYMFYNEAMLNDYINGEINEYLSQGYDNYFIVAPFETIKNKNMIMVTTHSRKLDKNVLNLLKSFSLFIEGDEFIYSRKCPVCSSFLIDFDETNYECLNCNSKYAVLKMGNKEENNKRDLIWIKRLSESMVKNEN